tara:strand:+ start:258 stop:587 length:330 start_codon:yes stop_codon:yes gene_type:complete
MRNKKIKKDIQDFLFEFRLGLDDIQDQQKIRYSMFNTPGPNPEKEILTPSDVSPAQIYTVASNLDKIPDNIHELRHSLNELLLNVGINDLSKKQIKKIYTDIVRIIEKD